jgi:hypothetical protein
MRLRNPAEAGYRALQRGSCANGSANFPERRVYESVVTFIYQPVITFEKLVISVFGDKPGEIDKFGSWKIAPAIIIT